MIELYFGDLTPEKQEEILAALGNNGNYDVYPIAVIQTPEDGKSEGGICNEK